MTTNYPTPVTELSDADLVSLSAELEEEYCYEDREGFTDWSDEDAEQRYDAMKAESWRRFLLANPDYVAPNTSVFLRMIQMDALNILQKKPSFSAFVSRNFDQEFTRPKIGATISVRMPQKFNTRVETQGEEIKVQ